MVIIVFLVLIVMLFLTFICCASHLSGLCDDSMNYKD